MGQTLQIDVRELKPELLQDYLRFFDQAFSDFPHWAGCYCGFYDTPGNDWDPTAKAGPEHRVARSQQISSGKAQGLLAYIDGTPVGWGHRGKGVCTALLNAAVNKFHRDGLQIAEGYPTTNPSKRTWEIPWAEENYKGPLSIYLKNGFKIHQQLERFAIVRKQL